jgi:hypothetical protein
VNQKHKTDQEEKPKIDKKKKIQKVARQPLGSSAINPDRRMEFLFGDEVLKGINLPTMSSNNPHVIQSKTGKGIMVINSPLIGALNDSDASTDMFRNALRLAKVSDMDAVLLTGNITFIISQNWGIKKGDKAIVSGLKIDPDKVEESYPSTIKDNPNHETARQKLEKGKLVFVTFRERVDTVVDMLRHVCTHENGKRAFDGSIFITFGKLEKELVTYMANELARIDFFKEEFMYRGLLASYRKDLRELGRGADFSGRARLLKKKIQDVQLMLNIVIRLKNAADESLKQKIDIIASYIIRRYEDAVHGAKVISIGDAYLAYGNKKIMITGSKRGNTDHTGEQATKFAEGLESFVKGHDASMVPNVLIGSGTNPVPEIKGVTYQASNEPGDKKMCMIIQAPVCVDAERYRDVIRDNARLSDDITRLASVGGFESGVITLRWHDKIEQPIVKFWPSHILKDHRTFRTKETIADMAFGRMTKFKMMYFHKEGCNHTGASDVWICECLNDVNGKYVKYFHQVAKEMMLACNAPLLGHFNDGDTFQAANHHYPKNGHPELLNPSELQNKIKKINNQRKISRKFKQRQIEALTQRQAIRSGIYELDKQIEEYASSLSESLYTDYWLMILRNAEKVGLSLTGTLAYILHIVGNHCMNTYKHSNVFRSDSLMATYIIQRNLLYRLIEKCLETKSLDDLKIARVVMDQMKSPSFGPLGEARGALFIPGHPEWAILLKHKQGKPKDANKRGRKRSMNEDEVGKHHINLSGDTHKGGVVWSRSVWNFQTGCQQGEGEFGREIDGSEQNVFAINFGIPVGGPSCGPSVVVFIDQATVRSFAQNPFAIDRSILFENSIE